MNILIIGNGAREHAIARACARSPKTKNIFCIGNAINPGIFAFTSDYYIHHFMALKNRRDTNHSWESAHPEIIKKAKEWQIDFAIIGPEGPLEQGIVDALIANGIQAIGPTQQLAQLESSKLFARNLMKQYQIGGSLLYQSFSVKSLEDNPKQKIALHNMAQDFLHQLGENRFVIKADGLMGGKGVKVAGDHLHSIEEGMLFCEELIGQNQNFIIEEKLMGEEFSLLCFSDGKHIVPMPVVQDHKRAFIDDMGPNTGGMGSYSDSNHSLPFLERDDVLQAKMINTEIMAALEKEYGEKYKGILYGSFIATQNGVKVIEFNARFGDPEAMNVLAILESDFVEICENIITTNLHSASIQFAKKATVCKYAVPHGYPDNPKKDFCIDISEINNQECIYYGAVNAKSGKLYATGSRAIAIVGVANSIAEAEKACEAEICRIQGPLFHRKDIGTETLIAKRIAHIQSLRSSSLLFKA